MPYSKRTPPVKVDVSIELYNVLLEVLNKNEKYSDPEIFESAKKLKEKLLRYSIPFIDKGTSKVQVPLFINEASEMIYHLLISSSDLEKTIDYYQVLLKVREAKSSK